MKLPVSWLKEYVDVRVEPEKLGHDLTMVGLAMDGLENHAGEAVLDLDVTTNRVDCMNVYGVAREVSVIYGLPLAPLAVELRESGEPALKSLDVRIEAPDLCPRFCARVLDVTLGPSPGWLRDRLERVGVRSINNVVDLTNYVMLEMGQPTHAFDLALVPAATLSARWGTQGEKLTTLDGQERTIPASPKVGFVASPEGPLAIAGVMGGASSEVNDDTRVVALEAAYWTPLAVRRAAKALGMHTEASHRFERGADPEGTALATARIAHLLQKIGAGSPRPGLIDRVAAPLPARTAPLRHSRVSLVLGTPVPEDRAEAILKGLGFEGNGGGEYTIPTWRGDVAREVDLIEEVGRHHGLERIPATLPKGGDAPGLRRWQARERMIRDLLVAAGLSEVITPTFPADPLGLEAAPTVALQNPLAEDEARLRRSLIAPGMISALQANVRQGRNEVRIFEVGRVFLPAERLATEERRLGVLLTGETRVGHWGDKPRTADFWDAEGVLSMLGERLDVGEVELQQGSGHRQLLHPGKSAAVLWRGESLGYVGALHPEVQERAGLPNEVFVAELKLDSWLRAQPEAVRFRPLPRHPAVSRDVSLLCYASLPAAGLQTMARQAGGPLLRSVRIADRYEGPPVPKGRVSLLLSLEYQDPSRTLTSEEVEASVAAIQSALKNAGAEIRGE